MAALCTAYLDEERSLVYLRMCNWVKPVNQKKCVPNRVYIISTDRRDPYFNRIMIEYPIKIVI